MVRCTCMHQVAYVNNFKTTVKILQRRMTNKDEIMEYQTYLRWVILKIELMPAIVMLVLKKQIKNTCQKVFNLFLMLVTSQQPEELPLYISTMYFFQTALRIEDGDEEFPAFGTSPSIRYKTTFVLQSNLQYKKPKRQIII